MIRIFHDTNGTGEYAIQTTCLDTDSFTSELAEALPALLSAAGDGADLAALGVLKNAMPIAFKLSGYKAETVMEQRTLVCGSVSPTNCVLLVSVGR